MNRFGNLLKHSSTAFNAITLNSFTMSASSAPSLAKVVDQLNAFAPLALAESWDNVGLLIEPHVTKPINRILLTNDLTESVLQEAVDQNTDLIISYHPPIFAPLKRITQNNWKERVVSKCIGGQIALYSPHTAWDSVSGGVNDWLASFVDGVVTSKPITDNGAGRLLTISPAKAQTLGQLIDSFKKHIKVERFNVAVGGERTLDSPVHSIALCAGSGASVLKAVAADLYITGEMSHHDVLDAVHRNVSVFACNHSNSERGFLEQFQPMLQQLLGGEQGAVTVVVSQSDKDPLLVF